MEQIPQANTDGVDNNLMVFLNTQVILHLYINMLTVDIYKNNPRFSNNPVICELMSVLADMNVLNDFTGSTDTLYSSRTFADYMRDKPEAREAAALLQTKLFASPLIPYLLQMP